MNISFIIVNYQSRQFLQQCIKSIYEHAPAVPCEILLANNDSEPLLNFLEKPGLKILENQSNVGFGQACNLAAKESNGEILFFLNPDTELKTSNVDDLVKAFVDPNLGIVAPVLVMASGAIQPWSAGKTITPWRTLLNNLGDKQDDFFQKQIMPSEADWVSGGAFAIRKKTFLECGGFDEKFFLYFEDIDLCKRLRSLGKKIIILSSVKVLHLGGQSISDIKKQKDFYYQSQDYYFKKHFGTIASLFIKLLRNIALAFKKI